MIRSLLIGALLAAVALAPAYAEDGDVPILSSGTETEIHMDFSNAKNTKGRSSFTRESVRRPKKWRGVSTRTRSNTSGGDANGSVSVTPKRSGAAETIATYAKNHEWLVEENKKLQEEMSEMKATVNELKEKVAAAAPGGSVPADVPGDAGGGQTPTRSTANTDEQKQADAVTPWKDWLSKLLFSLSLVCGIMAAGNLIRIPLIKGETPEEGDVSGFGIDMDDDEESPTPHKTARDRAFGSCLKFSAAAAALFVLALVVTKLPF